MTAQSIPPLLTKKKLVQMLQLSMSMRHPEFEFAINKSNSVGGEESFKIDIAQAGSKIFTCYIDNLYNSYEKKPDQLRKHLEQILVTVDTFFSDVEDKAPLLLPSIVTYKRLTEIQKNLLQARRAGILVNNSNLLHIPLVANLFVIFAFDKQNQISYPPIEILKETIPYETVDDLYTQACQNLTRKLLSKLTLDTFSSFGSSIKLDSHYDASILLIFDQWKDRLPFKNPPAIAIAAKDSIILVDSTDPQQTNTLKQFLQQTNQHTDDAFINELLTIVDGKIKLLKDTP